MLGYPLSRLVGHEFVPFMHPDDVESSVLVIERLATGTKMDKGRRNARKSLAPQVPLLVMQCGPASVPTPPRV